MTKKITVKFYRLSVSQAGDITFKEIFEKISFSPKKDRIFRIDEYPIWLDEYRIEEQYIIGDMVRLRMSNLPNKGNLSGIVEGLDFEDDEGICEHTAFFYHIKTRVILLQKVQGGVDIGRFCNYFNQINLGVIIDEPILEIDSIKNFIDDVKNVFTFDLKFARPDNLDCFSDIHPSVEGLYRINSELNSSIMEVKFSVGKKKDNSLFFQDVVKIIKSFVKIHEHDSTKVNRLKAEIESNTSEKKIIDLLDHGMSEVVNIEHESRSRIIPYSIRIEKLKEAWARRKDQINAMFSNYI